MDYFGHYWPFVPESPHIRVDIAAYPARSRPAWRTTYFYFCLQTDGLGNQTVLAEPLHRTQEVGGSNPLSPIELSALLMRCLALRPLV